jgi:DNA-binding CsgD family transcriptional regulator
MLFQLRACLDQARRGNGRNVLVSGEAGIGKSTLLREFAATAGKGIRLLWGVCDAMTTPRPLGPLQDVAAGLGSRLQQMVENQQGHSALFSALLQNIEGSNSVTLFIIEDIHWADSATLDLVRYLGRRMPFLRAMLVLSARSDEIDSNHPLVQALAELPAAETVRIELQALSAAAVAQLAAGQAQDAHRLYDITQGNPFFVTELLLAGTIAGARLPQSVRDAVWARLQKLSSEERAMLELLSLSPGSSEPWFLQGLLGADAFLLAERCCESGVLTVDAGGAFVFRHELARLATLESLSESARRAGHRRIVAMLSQRPDVPLARIVHHADAAGDVAAVLQFAPLAAREAAALGAHLQAAKHLATALSHANGAGKELRAQLLEDWSYEAGLSQALDNEVVAARRQAANLWRELGRRDKTGLNLRWLSRLHWYRGEATLADQYLTEAVTELEAAGPGPELAMAYSTRSQYHMLHDRMEEAVAWGKRAIALATQVGAEEIRAHALNNVGSAMLFSGDDGGKSYMEESLSVSLRHGFHEQAARAYTNYSEYAVITKQFGLAERLLNDGIAFDTENDLASWTYYLIGRQAQLRLEQGRLAEARAIAESVLDRDGQTMLMKLPALIVLGRTLLRLGDGDASVRIAEAARNALTIGEQQYVSAAMLAQIEEAWITGDAVAGTRLLHELSQLRLEDFDPWERGEVLVWWKRLMPENELLQASGPVSRPRRLELEGDSIAAAEEWLRLGVPYEAALAYLHDRRDPPDSLARAVSLLEDLGAAAASLMARRRLQQIGGKIRLSGKRRGPYASARSNPLGLTAKEMQVLQLITAGKSNLEISEKLARSQRTVEHHVSAVLSKFSARSRLDLVLRLRQEPWLLAGGPTVGRKLGTSTDLHGTSAQ